MNPTANSPWPAGQRCAVSLTYDDAVPVHYQHVAPLLSAKGLTGTFNLTGQASVTEAIEQWRHVAEAGHELGNHTLFHPCRRDPPERYGWLEPHYDLCAYTMQRLADELRVANALLRLIDRRTRRTFAHPCGHATVGPAGREISIDDLVLRLFVAGRGSSTGRLVDPACPNYASLGCVGGDGKTFDSLRESVEQAVECGAWLIFIFHGVGKGTHGGYVETEAHDALVDYLAANADRCWGASMVEVALHLQAQAPAKRPDGPAT